jgi:hypothetical protein
VHRSGNVEAGEAREVSFPLHRSGDVNADTARKLSLPLHQSGYVYAPFVRNVTNTPFTNSVSPARTTATAGLSILVSAGRPRWARPPGRARASPPVHSGGGSSRPNAEAAARVGCHPTGHARSCPTDPKSFPEITSHRLALRRAPTLPAPTSDVSFDKSPSQRQTPVRGHGVNTRWPRYVPPEALLPEARRSSKTPIIIELGGTQQPARPSDRTSKANLPRSSSLQKVCGRSCGGMDVPLAARHTLLSERTGVCHAHHALRLRRRL